VRRLGLSILATAALLWPIAAAAAVPRSDSQVWGEVDVTAPIQPWLSAMALGVVREGDHLPNPTLAGGGVTLDARSGPWTVTVGDLWVAVRSPASGGAIDVNVPLAAIAYGASLGGFEFNDRNRVEQLQGLAGGGLALSQPAADRAPLDRLRTRDVGLRQRRAVL
jgi:hypothetical protein